MKAFRDAHGNHRPDPIVCYGFFHVPCDRVPELILKILSYTQQVCREGLQPHSLAKQHGVSRATQYTVKKSVQGSFSSYCGGQGPLQNQCHELNEIGCLVSTLTSSQSVNSKSMRYMCALAFPSRDGLLAPSGSRYSTFGLFLILDVPWVPQPGRPST